jgi:Ca2+-transporting ATPase
MAAKGLRVLALAEKVKKNAGEKPYRRLVLLGIAGFADPPREEIKPYIEKCHKAGMRIVMVTGDQSLTAKSVATSLGIVKGPEAEVILGQQISVAQDLSDEQNRRFLDANIFARVSPAKKLGILSLYREKGFIVAMTGDGVNDAPALKKADIGIAMAKRGTQVASQAADMVLKDDSFSTIVAAVEQGRVIFANIRKFLLYLIPCHVSEVTAIALAPLLKMPLPVLPLQILFLNIVTDTFPALALGMSEGSPGVMNEPPRDPEEPVITRKQWFWITAHGVVMGLAVIAALYFAIHYMKNVKEKAVTVSFLTLGFTSLWHVFNVRAKGSGILKNDIVSNPFVWAAVFLGVVLMVSAVFIPGFNNVIGLEAPDMNGWGLALFLSFVPLVIGQVMKKIRPK